MDGTKIYLECTVSKIDYIDTYEGKVVIATLIDNGGNKWLAMLNSIYLMQENEYDNIAGKRVVFCGVYEGYSSVYERPSVTLTKLCVKDTGEIKTGMGLLAYWLPIQYYEFLKKEGGLFEPLLLNCIPFLECYQQIKGWQ